MPDTPTVGIDLYSDAGVYEVNPSPVGGAWAFVVVAGGKVEKVVCQAVSCHELGAPTVENNLLELMGAVRALQYAAGMRDVTLHTDSLSTKLRVEDPVGTKMKGVPQAWVDLLREVRAQVTPTVVLLAGHPTRRHLAAGYKVKPSGKRFPVSEFNVMADAACSQVMKACFGG